MQGSLDADRLASPARAGGQLNTGNGGGEYLDANMVRSALPALPLEEIDLLIVENVGNLVCPAEFRIGEDVRIMVSSVAEGEDKPLKYPLMFRACELVVINKLDLLPHVDFDMERYLHHLDAVHPGVETMISERPHGRGRGVPVVAGAGPGARAGVTAAAARSEAARRSSRPRPSGSRGCATRWPSSSRPAAADRRGRVGLGALGPPPRRGRVRPSRDRRQARAAAIGLAGEGSRSSPARR